MQFPSIFSARPRDLLPPSVLMTSKEKDPFGGETAFPWCGMAACLFLALVRVFWTGYQFGVGNQSIQIPMLLRWADPGLFPKDLMLNATTADYPSLFFRTLALALPLRQSTPDLRMLEAARLFWAGRAQSAAPIELPALASTRSSLPRRSSGCAGAGRPSAPPGTPRRPR